MLELHEFEKNRSRKNVMRLADEERGYVHSEPGSTTQGGQE